MPARTEGLGIDSMNSKRRRSAVSISANERSAVFIVPITSTFEGTLNASPEYGSVTVTGYLAPSRLSTSTSVMSSPKILLMFPRLISSITMAYCRDGFLRARSQSLKNAPGLIS
ncbi:hypothetical protein D3C73_775850 [compost metagenome]